jgi:hypothetical protein
MRKTTDESLPITMRSRLSTDARGIAACLGLQAEARVELKQILELLQAKISSASQFMPVSSDWIQHSSGHTRVFFVL